MNLTWNGARSQRSTPMEKSRRPISRPGQEELNLSKYVWAAAVRPK